jgi:hypothetical protein
MKVFSKKFGVEKIEVINLNIPEMTQEKRRKI